MQKVCVDFPNLTILTKSATPGKFQLTFVHASVGNKYLREFVAAFVLAGSLNSTYVISIDINIAFATDSDNIRLPITKVCVCDTAANLVQSKKQQDWTPRNAVLLPPFIIEAAILEKGGDAGELLKIFSCSVTERAEEGEEVGGDDNDDDKKESKGGLEAEE